MSKLGTDNLADKKTIILVPPLPADPDPGLLSGLKSFDEVAGSLNIHARVVGGWVLRCFSGRSLKHPRDMDVQVHGSGSDAARLEIALRSKGLPANCRHVGVGGVQDMMSHASGWRHVYWQKGLFADNYGLDFLARGEAVVLANLPDTHLAIKSFNNYVEAEYRDVKLKVVKKCLNCF